MLSQSAIFLDRDGVLNQAFLKEGKTHPPADLAQFKILPGVLEAIWLLKNVGYLIIVVTNQPDVGRGLQDQKIVESMHEYLLKQLPIDDLYVCYHTGSDVCACRKPKPGMLIAAQKRWNLSMSESMMVGDRWSDIAAGHAAGCGKQCLIGTGYGEPVLASADYHAESLLDWCMQLGLPVK